ncbi:M61 family metallopeptidase [Christiangramia flava]|uniref:Uncharacterized protein n=1 Tax=Christiangramia flava JLT2011 TaxID=1229726 RepID=A0A1L7I124_9FLAO|nr:M61 family metallopeptidase [Christiangramia flava]APU67308.1 hypothetical protein GRFL_0584 [Christiangramia flava JLT2011]OSS39893.1 Peptidase M61 [Christiangramia flava JLT2011]
MNRFLSLLLLVGSYSFLVPSASAFQKDAELAYMISFKEPAAHFAEVQLKLVSLDSARTTLVLPVWTPGYYKILDNPAHIIDFKVSTISGEPLQWHKIAKNKWLLENGQNAEVFVDYRVYANRKSVAESNISEEKAFMANTDIFMFPEGNLDKSVSLQVHLPKQWDKIATGLTEVDQGKFYAPDFDVLYDSPLYLGNQKIIEFQELEKKITLSIATPEGLDQKKFVADLRKILRSTTKLMQHIPFNDYTFIMMEPGGGGLEHWNSQAVFTYGSFNFENDLAYKRFLNFLTHEYFHLYNVKAIRPIELGPFDYSQENYTTMLWVAEGFTVYYEYLIMRNAGLLTANEVLEFLSSHIKAIENKSGKDHMSLERSSFDVWNYFLNNDAISAETTISYYQKGPVMALLLDIAIRNDSDNEKSLDDVMRYLYEEFYRKQGRGYTENEFWDSVTKMAGKPQEELRKYVESTGSPDYEKYLKLAALSLDRSSADDEKTELVEKQYDLIKIVPENDLQLKIRKSLLQEN